MLVPSDTLRGITYLDTPESARRAATALAPLVHTIVVLSHLGFDNDVDSDVHIIPSLKGTKVAAILGGHTHEALDPSPVIAGMITCNAGAHGVNVNQVRVSRDAHGSISIQSKLLPQDESVLESRRFLAAREQELESFRPLQDNRVPLPPDAGPHSGGRRDREVGLLRTALHASQLSSPDAIQMVPHLYMVGELPADGSVNKLEVLTVYPNAEQLVEIELSGAVLKQLLALQGGLAFFYSAVPVWLESGAQVADDDVQDDRTYTIVTTPLAAEGGLNWHTLHTQRPTIRPLGTTCAELVWSYLHADDSGAAIR
jgi:2',3'-cyclic-nucleotide 2'-phosphodiesterase (5'-nucleotidase family)